MLPQASAEYYAAERRISATVLRGVRRQWQQMGSDFGRSWETIGPRIVALVAAGQVAAGREAEPYVARVLDETDQLADRVARPAIAPLVGVSAEGLPLAEVLQGGIITARARIGEGAGVAEALAAGGRWLDMASTSIVADAGRSATSVSIAARPDVGGYVRMVNTPSCSRCVILAGRFYRWNSGFPRHPRCDCVHIPASENIAGDMRTDPELYFWSIDSAEQDRIFGKAGAEVIRSGADMNQVVNARRGMYTTAEGQLATRTGTSRRGFAGQRMEAAGSTVEQLSARRVRTVRQARLMPETILATATSREQAIEMLHRYGYLL